MVVSGFCFRLPFKVKLQMEKDFLPVDLTSKRMPCYWRTTSLPSGIWLHMLVTGSGEGEQLVCGGAEVAKVQL